MNNTRERLRIAVQGLAEGSESLSDRLKGAFEALLPLRSDDFSIPKLKSEFESIMFAAHRRQTLDESLEIMSEEDMQLIARYIVTLFEHATIIENGGKPF